MSAPAPSRIAALLTSILVACGGSAPAAVAPPSAPTATVAVVPSPTAVPTSAATASASASASRPAVTWTEVAAPAQAAVAATSWIRIAGPAPLAFLGAVFRPSGAGPFPVVVVLHGTESFRNTHLVVAKDMAAGGFVAIAPCWYGGHYTGAQDPRPATVPDGIDCPDGGPVVAGNSTAAREAVRSLVEAARTLPGVRADRVALLGHSRGSVASTYFGGTAGGIQAIVAAAGYSRVDSLRTMPPVLILQGTADTVTPEAQAHQFEDALKRAGIAVEAEYVAGAPHSYLFDQATHAAAIARATAFLKKTLP